MSCVRNDLLVTLKDGRLNLLFWEDPIEKQKSIHLGDIMFSVDMQVSGIYQLDYEGLADYICHVFIFLREKQK